MSDIYLLDTNAAIALLKGDPAIDTVLSRLELYVPGIVLGELYFGAEKSGRIEENLRRVDEFAAKRSILHCDTETSRWYGRIRHQLRAKGRPIPQNDVWIAAVALQHDLTLLTRDVHFKEVDNLPLKSW
ncbi:MAG: type II toxin-antitoxin system VapC family toxin [Chloroflexota bacterium]